MALSDLISKPVASPLEGFDKSVQTGFELAQNQERVQVAQQQIALQKERIDSEYLEKATGLFQAYGKADPRMRKLISKSIVSVLSKVGIQPNEELIDAMNSDPELGGNISQRILQIQAKYPGRPDLARIEMSQELGKDTADAFWEQNQNKQKFDLATYQSMLQRAGVNRTAFMGAKSRDIRLQSEELNKLSDNINKQNTEINRSILNVESAIESNDIARAYQVMGDLAKGLGGLSGVLSDLDMATQIQRTFGGDVNKIKAYVFGKGEIPEEVKKNLKARIGDFRKNLTEATSQKLMSQIKERQLDPRYKQTFGVYALKDNSGRTIPKIGFGAARIIEKNNETLRMMKMAQEEISLEDLVAQEATPPTPQKLLELITSAATGRNKQKTRYFIRFNTNSVVQPPSIEEVYGQPESVGFEDIQMGE